MIAAARLRADVESRVARGERVAVLARRDPVSGESRAHWLAAPAGPGAYAHDLYANLRALDERGADVIAIEAVPDDAAWLAVRDRLTRATRGDDDDRD